MHTVQIVLTDVEDVDIADRGSLERHMNSALLQENEGSYWWDWWAVGGRWEDYLKETIGPMIWPNQLESPVAIKLTKDNWPLAIKLLEDAIEHQARSVMQYVDEIKESGVDLNDYILNFNTEITGWKIPYCIKNIFAIKTGDWTPDSGYVDATNWMDASPNRLLNYLKDPENAKDDWDGRIEDYALVVVDFHF